MPQFIQVSAPFFPITKRILKEKYFEISYSTAVPRLRICPRSHVCVYTYICMNMRTDKNAIYINIYSIYIQSNIFTHIFVDMRLTSHYCTMVCHCIPPSIGPSISPGSMSTVVIVSEVKGLRPGRPIHAIWIPRFLGLLTRMTTKTSLIGNHYKRFSSFFLS